MRDDDRERLPYGSFVGGDDWLHVYDSEEEAEARIAEVEAAAEVFRPNSSSRGKH
jgi:hypothetical protein